MSTMLSEFDAHHLHECSALVGVDEAGRGPLAGPVVAAAVYVPKAYYQSLDPNGVWSLIQDSKKMSESNREQAYAYLQASQEKQLLRFAYTVEGVGAIETLNILGATRSAMRQSIDALKLDRGRETIKLWIDGRPLKDFEHEHEGIVKGDAKSLAIAMASVVAKVVRDRIMVALDADFPEYGFAKHKGYGTAAHRKAIIEQGPCSEHRPSFLKKILAAH